MKFKAVRFPAIGNLTVSLKERNSYFEWTEVIGKQWGLKGYGKFENDSLFLDIISYGDCGGPIQCAIKGGDLN